MNNVKYLTIKKVAAIFLVILNISCNKEKEDELHLNKLPTTPILIEPLNGIISLSDTILFSWEESFDYEGDDIMYILYLSADSVHWEQRNVGRNTEYKYDLIKGQKYYWKVEAANNFIGDARYDANISANLNNVQPEESGQSISEVRHVFTATGRIKNLVEKSGDKFIEVSWTGFTNLEYVEITFEPEEPHIKQPIVVNAPNNKFKLDGLINQVAYSFNLKAIDIYGHCSETEIIRSIPLIETQVHDRDLNIYHLIKIGEQTWLRENLRATKWQDGTPIPNEYYMLGDDGEIYYTSDVAWPDSVGFWLQKGNPCPCGYRVASDEDWLILEKYLGMNDDEINKYDTIRGTVESIGTILKSSTDWNIYEGQSGNGTDEFLFTVFPVGAYRYLESPKQVIGLGEKAYIWSSYTSEYNAFANYRIFSNEHDGIYRVSYLNRSSNFACSIRCLKE